jgi:hypothetical protein
MQDPARVFAMLVKEFESVGFLVFLGGLQVEEQQGKVAPKRQNKPSGERVPERFAQNFALASYLWMRVEQLHQQFTAGAALTKDDEAGLVVHGVQLSEVS